MVGEAGLQTVDTPQVPVGCFVTVGTQFNQILDKVLKMGQEGGYGLGPTVVELETDDLVLNARAHGIGSDTLSELGDELRVEHLGISRVLGNFSTVLANKNRSRGFKQSTGQDGKDKGLGGFKHGLLGL